MGNPTKLFIGSALFLLFSTWSYSQTATNEFRAIWTEAWHAGFTKTSEVAKLVQDLREANCNTAIVQVRKRGDAYYSGSKFEPRSKLIAPNYDPLAEVLKQAHDVHNGPRLDVHAWLVVYPVSYKKMNEKTKKLEIVHKDPKHPFRLHKDWLSQVQKGATYDGNDFSFDPGHPDVQRHIFNVAMDIVSRYDVDGLHLDHARYVSDFWGYNPVSVARFNKLFARVGTPKFNDPDWTQFRRDQVTDLIRKIYLSAIDLKPGLKISASTIAWAPGITSDGQWKSTMAYKSALQDWRAWMEEGILDINMPMLFFDETKPSLSKYYADWNDFAKDHAYGRAVVPGVGGWFNPSTSISKQIHVARTASAKTNYAAGVALYSYAKPNIDTNSTLFKTVGEGIFTNAVSIPELSWKTKPTVGHLKGFVTADNGTNYLDGVKVELTGSATRKLHSDATGFYGAVDLSPGKYSLITAFPGFAPVTNEVTIAVGKVTTHNILLKTSNGKQS